jgi:hypothetical protein
MDPEIKKQEFETADEFYSLINLMLCHLQSSSSNPARRSEFFFRIFPSYHSSLHMNLVGTRVALKNSPLHALILLLKKEKKRKIRRQTLIHDPSM